MNYLLNRPSLPGGISIESCSHIEGGVKRISAEFDFASGDRSGPGYQRFDTLFGMRRADLAPAGIYNAIGRANILTPGIRAEVALGKRLDGFVVSGR